MNRCDARSGPLEALTDHVEASGGGERRALQPGVTGGTSEARPVILRPQHHRQEGGGAACCVTRLAGQHQKV